MALELRPNCEMCDVDLAADSPDARICTYECTFCADCVDNNLLDVCPNCGGGFVTRPIRPATEWREGVSLAHQPASTHRKKLSYEHADIEKLVQRVRHIRPHDR